ncbi:MAG: right-handed parallel beta-helix repeat-containing protein [Bacteroidia bacterium]
MLRLLLIPLFLLGAFAFGATFVVDSNADTDNNAAYTLGDGTNTLRKCIRLANANFGSDNINFNITGSTVINASFCSGFGWFFLTSPVIIDGYSQPGASAGNPQIELNGNGLTCLAAINLTFGSTGSEIKGLIMYGNTEGVRMDANTSGNTVSGCWIGVNNTGNAVATSTVTQHGIHLVGSNNNTIGGNGGLIDRNIISACGQEGVRIDGAISSGNAINGNYIGVGANGSTDLGNRNGVFADDAAMLTIGAGAANEGNVISGNAQTGISLENCDNFTIKGNIIGLAANASTAVQNDLDGITATSGSDVGQIGGATLNERNVISGNGRNGINLTSCDNITIQGSYMGVAGDGFTVRANTGNGVRGENCEFLEVGGDAAGEGNVVSGNTSTGVSVLGVFSRNTTIQGNMIGVSANGLTAVSNGAAGIGLNESEDSQIGGTALAARNVVSNNLQSGMFIANSPRVVIENNYVGVNGTGLVDMGNSQLGVFILNSQDCTIGGVTRRSRNIISGNAQNGLVLDGTSSGATIKANFVGIGADGSTLIKNDQHGIVSQGSSNNMIVGGPTAAERNVSSGNGSFTVGADPDNGIVGDGIRLLGTDNHLIQNNYFGTDSTGTIGLGNHWAGISINDGATNNDILDNLVSDNRNEGIWVWNGSNNNEFYRNVVGETSTGAPLGNWDFGVYIDFTSSSGNVFGGSLANANVIAHTRGERPSAPGDGVTIAGGAGNNNTFTFNNIHCNAGKGIQRTGASNESQAAPVINFSNSNSISGTGDNGRTIHIYTHQSTGTGCDCEGETYVGSTTVSGGAWSFTHNLGLAILATGQVTATQTTATGSTSEFATCIIPVVLPVSFLDFDGERMADGSVALAWSTASEVGNDYFKIQRSTDNQRWEAIGTVEGVGNTTSISDYQYVDAFPPVLGAKLYYRLAQVDVNGTTHLSQTLQVNIEGNDVFQIYPNPTNNTLHIQAKGLEGHDFRLYDMYGRAVDRDVNVEFLNANHATIDVSALSSGTYIFQSNNQAYKIIKR